MFRKSLSKSALTQPVNEQLILGAGVSGTFADKNYVESFFAVTAGQAVRSGFKAYKPAAGVKSVDPPVSATCMFNENWMVRAAQGVGFPMGDAADEPDREAKGPAQIHAGIALSILGTALVKSRRCSSMGTLSAGTPNQATEKLQPSGRATADS